MSLAVIITGASSGIGKALAEAFAKRGFRMGLIARREQHLQNIAHKCLALGAEQVEYYSADVSVSAQNLEALAYLDNLLGGADIFIANAGIGELCPPTENCGISAQRVFGVNLIGAVEGIELMKYKMLQRGRGQIVGVTSFAAVRGLPGARIYCASKAGLFTYLEAVRAELAAYDIPVTIVAPGYIKTPLTDKNPFPMPFLMDVNNAASYFVDKILKKKRLIIVPRIWRPLFWILRCIPDFIYATISKYLFRSEKRNTWNRPRGGQ
ncbi:MAG: SDR family NAD(P)-dependent oxidoreductase [Chlamydiota bacterium]